jgi:hypothetical protein
VWRRVRIPLPCESQKATGKEPGAWGYNWTTLSLEDIKTETWSSRLGLTTLFGKEITVTKSKEPADESGRIF